MEDESSALLCLAKSGGIADVPMHYKTDVLPNLDFALSRDSP